MLLMAKFIRLPVTNNENECLQFISGSSNELMKRIQPIHSHLVHNIWCFIAIYASLALPEIIEKLRRRQHCYY